MPPRPGTKHARKLYDHFENAAKKDIENSIALAQAYLSAYDKAVVVKSKKKNGGNEDFVREDKWINSDLSKDVKSRGYMTRSELITTLPRGSYLPYALPGARPIPRYRPGYA